MSTTGVLLLAAAALLIYEGVKLISGSGRNTDVASAAPAPSGAPSGSGAGAPPAVGGPAAPSNPSSPPSSGGAAVHPGQWEQAVADWARANGVDPLIAIATVYGESNGYGNAVNSTDPNGGSYGIFQINGIHIAGMGGDWGVNPAGLNDPTYILGQTPEGRNWVSAFRNVSGSTSPSNAAAFLSRFWPQAQGSVQPSQQQVADALAQAQAAQQRGFWH